MEKELTPASPQITQLLRSWSGGDESALDELTPLVYQQLHRASRAYLAREAPGHTLQATGLINEVYLRLVNLREVDWKDRAHFFAVCAQLMRRILTDFARSKRYMKRGANAPHVSLDGVLVVSKELPRDIVALDDALKLLAKVDPRASQVVELRFFGGLSVEETAEVLKISRETVTRDWRAAKAWLLRELTNEQRNES